MDKDETKATRVSLLIRIRDLNDVVAWRDFVECYAPGIYGWCRRFGLQEADAADATQVVLMRLVDGMKSFDYDARRGRFRGWLKTVTNNVAVDIVRSWRERAAGGTAFEYPDGDFESDPAVLLEREVERAYQMELLRRASTVVQLKVKPTTWEAWRLSSESVPPAEVARRIGISVADVYVAKSRVIRMLRDETRSIEATDESPQ